MIPIRIILGFVVAAVVAALLRPLLRGAPELAAVSSNDVEVYRSQLDELDRELQRGLIAETEASEAQLEVERRLLIAARRAEETRAAFDRPAWLAASAIMIGVPVIAIGLYLRLGAPNYPDQPFSSREVARQPNAGDGAHEAAAMKAALEERLKADPTSLDGWMLLGRVDATLGAWDEGTAALARAVGLSQKRPDVVEVYGEMLVGAAGGEVTPGVMDLFAGLVADNRKMFRARHYLALAAAQRGELAQAIAEWKALETELPADTPWRSSVIELRQAAESHLASQASVGGAPSDAAADAMAKLPSLEQAKAIRGMVDGLAARLKVNPDDLAGWEQLARSYDVLGEDQKAEEAYREVLRRDPKQPDALRKLGLAAAR